MAKPTCPCCGEEMEVRPTASGKPYASCDGCRVQVFVRGTKGVEKYNARYGTDYKTAKATAATPPAAPAAAAAPAAKKPTAGEPKKTGNDADMFS